MHVIGSGKPRLASWTVHSKYSDVGLHPHAAGNLLLNCVSTWLCNPRKGCTLFTTGSNYGHVFPVSRPLARMRFLCYAHWFAWAIHIRRNCVHGLPKLLVGRAWASPTIASRTVDFSYIIYIYIYLPYVRRSVNPSWALLTQFNSIKFNVTFRAPAHEGLWDRT